MQIHLKSEPPRPTSVQRHTFLAQQQSPADPALNVFERRRDVLRSTKPLCFRRPRAASVCSHAALPPEGVPPPSPPRRSAGHGISLHNSAVPGPVSVGRANASRGVAAEFDAAIVDGTNLMLLSRGDAGFGVSHTDAFTAWLRALLELTACNQLYVVFDNKRGGGSSSGRAAAPAVVDARRAAVPNYLDNRHGKMRRKQQGPRGGGAAADGPSDSRQRLGPQQHQSAQPQPQYDIPELRRACEALMERPPPHLFRYVNAVRHLGGLVLYGLPGHEADDLIASLADGLLPAPAAPNSAATATTTTGSPSAAASARCQRVGRVVIISADSDMLQLLGRPGCAWLELRQLSSATSPQADCPLAVRAKPLAPGIPEALLRLHRAAAADDDDDRDDDGADNSTMAAAGAAGPTAAASGQVGPDLELPQAHQQQQRQQQRQGREQEQRSQGLLPPAAHADYLALAGKPEAGVPGVGVGGRGAKKLLERYGSVEGVVQAYELGALDGALRPVAVAGGGGPSNSYPPAVRQALLNVRVTRMRADVASVPWNRISDYQRWRRRQEPSPPPRQRTAHRTLGGGQDGPDLGFGAEGPGAWPRSGALAEAGAVPGASLPLLPPLHPQDLLHAASAAPFARPLTIALRHRGLSCRVNVVDEQGRLIDFAMYPVDSPLTAADGGGGGAGPATVDSERALPAQKKADAANAVTAGGAAAAGSEIASPGDWCAPPVDAEAVEAAADALVRLAREQQPGGADAGCAVPLRVCVLSPWDFQFEAMQPKGRRQAVPPRATRGLAAAAPPLSRPAADTAAVPSGDAAGVDANADGGDDAARGRKGATAAQREAEELPQRRQQQLQQLDEFAQGLRAAVGRRASLAHTPKVLQAALRSTTAWRLKRLQRSAAAEAAAAAAEAEAKGSGMVAVVPFYELMAQPSAAGR